MLKEWDDIVVTRATEVATAFGSKLGTRHEFTTWYAEASDEDKEAVADAVARFVRDIGMPTTAVHVPKPGSDGAAVILWLNFGVPTIVWDLV